MGVYPRVCGGTPGGPGSPRPPSGLSPRVRGNQHHGLGASQRLRSIPACAGEPRSRTAVKRTGTVYPRVCGGTTWVDLGETIYVGLSPRVRGNLSMRNTIVNAKRSIPACAGEPLSVVQRARLIPVYPRVCGGTCQLATASITSDGLSPRVRGNRTSPARAAYRHRSIPACAGEP